MPTADHKPSWRKIESALTGLFQEYSLEVFEEHGDKYVALGDRSILIEALARDLEDRL